MEIYACNLWGRSRPISAKCYTENHIEEHEQEDPEFVRKVVSSLFVDDFVGGGGNSKKVMRLKKKLTEVMHKGGSTLHKWKSNSQELRQTLLKEAEGNSDETFAKQSLNSGENHSKVLGIKCKWNSENDVMAAELSQVVEKVERDQSVTERERVA